MSSIKFTGTHLYTWVEKGTVRVKCFTQEYNTISPARTRNPDHSIQNQTHKPHLNASINVKPEERGGGGGAYEGHLTFQKNV